MPARTTQSAASEETFGQRLARLRTEAGFTQREFARELGVSQRMVAYYETKEEHPFTALLPAISRALGISIDVLLGIERSSGKGMRPANQRLWRRFRQIEQLPAKERKQLLSVVDAYLERDKLSRVRGP